MGKSSVGESLGGGEKKDTLTKLKKLSWGYTWRKIFSLSINANLTLCDPLTVAWVEKIFAHWLSIISLKKNIFCSSHIKTAYTKEYVTQKLINQFLDQVEYPI